MWKASGPQSRTFRRTIPGFTATLKNGRKQQRVLAVATRRNEVAGLRKHSLGGRKFRGWERPWVWGSGITKSVPTCRQASGIHGRFRPPIQMGNGETEHASGIRESMAQVAHANALGS